MEAHRQMNKCCIYEIQFSKKYWVQKFYSNYLHWTFLQFISSLEMLIFLPIIIRVAGHPTFTSDIFLPWGVQGSVLRSRFHKLWFKFATLNWCSLRSGALRFWFHNGCYEWVQSTLRRSTQIWSLRGPGWVTMTTSNSKCLFYPSGTRAFNEEIKKGGILF